MDVVEAVATPASQGSSSLEAATSEQANCAASPSLASSLFSFSPPTPGPQQLAAAALVQASVELAALAEAARCAATACPESTPLVEVLCAAVADELVVLKASAASSQSLDAETAAALNQRISELRAATGEGLQVLRTALDAHIVVKDVAEPISDPVLARTSSLPSLHRKEREMAQIFGSVATDMRQAVLEIREAKARHAINRSQALVVMTP